MKTIDAFAPLRPRPSGPPLRGRAALHEGIRNWRPCWPPRQGTSGGGFHLKLADPWSKIGGRRTLPPSPPTRPSPSKRPSSPRSPRKRNFWRSRPHRPCSTWARPKASPRWSSFCPARDGTPCRPPIFESRSRRRSLPASGGATLPFQLSKIAQGGVYFQYPRPQSGKNGQLRERAGSGKLCPV